MNLRDRIEKAAVEGKTEEIVSMLGQERRAMRYLLSLLYKPDENIVKTGATAIARSAADNKKMVRKIILRLVWAMDPDSGTYAPMAPSILRAIADENPELLVPVAADLTRLAGDTSLNDGLCDTLRTVASRCPGEIGLRLSKALNSRPQQACEKGRRR
jgi:hypothetical protein